MNRVRIGHTRRSEASDRSPTFNPPNDLTSMLRSALSCSVVLVAFVASAQCGYVPSSATNNDSVSYTFVGGSLQSYGCAPIDPTYWMSGNGMSITANFTYPTDQPTFRVWGMNNDDVASVLVNGTAFNLDPTSATIDPKVVCGDSPGPDGVSFSGGNITGSSSANYSYQDVHLDATGVTSLTVNSLSGAGWGFAGVLLDCSTGVSDQRSIRFILFPNPSIGQVGLQGDLRGNEEVTFTNELGQVTLQRRAHQGLVDLSGLAAGVYAVTVRSGDRIATRRLLVQ
jgi:Secretion system C-terminal sorting domain